MTPGQPLHDAVAVELHALVDLAERHASLRRPAMESAEKLVMSYADPYETDPATGRRLHPHERSIVVPFTAAAVETLVAFWLMSFTSRQPTIPLKSHDPRYDRAAEYAETIMDAMHDDDGIDAKMWSWLWSAAVYGRGYMHTCWYAEHELRYVEQAQLMLGMLGISLGTEQVQQAQWQLVEERQVNTPLEPRMVLQDPRAPGWDPQQGEFIGFETWMSWNRLKGHEIEGQLFNVDRVKQGAAGGQDQRTSNNLSPGQYAPARHGQQATPGDPGYYQAYHVWVRLIPAEWPRPEVAIGSSYVPQIWEFVLIDQTICRARPSSQRTFPVYSMDRHFDANKLFNPGDV